MTVQRLSESGQIFSSFGAENYCIMRPGNSDQAIALLHTYILVHACRHPFTCPKREGST